MKNIVVLSIVLTGASAFAIPGYGQASDLGAAAGFALFTGNGAFTNTLTSVVTGDIGTDNGALTGFPPGTLLSGQMHVGDAPSALAAIAVTDAYDSLTEIACETQIDATLVSQTLGAGVYCSGGAVSLNGNLVLDGDGNPDAVFIFKIGGLFSMEDEASITLTNGASYDNVYWQVAGAFNMAGSAALSGTMIAHDAISLLNGASITGRGLSVAGAILISNNVVTLPSAALPVTLSSFNVSKGEGHTAVLSWITTAETRSDRFEPEHGADGKSWSKLGTVIARGESAGLSAYRFTDEAPMQRLNFYRLKMIDTDGTFSYSSIRSIAFEQAPQLSSYPNPAVNRITLTGADMTSAKQIQINDMKGNRVYNQQNSSSEKLPGYIDVSFLPAGVYILRIVGNEGDLGTFRLLKQ